MPVIVKICRTESNNPIQKLFIAHALNVRRLRATKQSHRRPDEENEQSESGRYRFWDEEHDDASQHYDR
ncbi:hypothetical protein GCM10009000_010350 [Halobacterium noricense]|uniref:Transposase n=1 Tax=Haladaptatus pallidirubidus TaxID=1008152 RepID=A0AAV3UC87_9EURY